jgi:hypothetical protein
MLAFLTKKSFTYATGGNKITSGCKIFIKNSIYSTVSTVHTVFMVDIKVQ